MLSSEKRTGHPLLSFAVVVTEYGLQPHDSLKTVMQGLESLSDDTLALNR